MTNRYHMQHLPSSDTLVRRLRDNANDHRRLAYRAGTDKEKKNLVWLADGLDAITNDLEALQDENSALREHVEILQQCELCERQTGQEALETLICVHCWNTAATKSDRLEKALRGLLEDLEMRARMAGDVDEDGSCRLPASHSKVLAAYLALNPDQEVHIAEQE